jgi:hypothetical protein
MSMVHTRIDLPVVVTTTEDMVGKLARGEPEAMSAVLYQCADQLATGAPEWRHVVVHDGTHKARKLELVGEIAVWLSGVLCGVMLGFLIIAWRAPYLL